MEYGRDRGRGKWLFWNSCTCVCVYLFFLISSAFEWVPLGTGRRWLRFLEKCTKTSLGHFVFPRVPFCLLSWLWKQYYHSYGECPLQPAFSWLFFYFDEVPFTSCNVDVFPWGTESCHSISFSHFSWRIKHSPWWWKQKQTSCSRSFVFLYLVQTLPTLLS